MFNLFKKKEQKSKVQYKNIVWHEVGDGNPFNKRVLDVREYTLNHTFTTRSKAVAEKYNASRQSDGKEYVGHVFKNATFIETALKYPPIDRTLTDMIFRSQSFDEKWDIYIYDNCFYFVRSWTGDLIYKAYATSDANNVTIHKIEMEGEDKDAVAVSTVHFLVTTQILKGIIPHQVPSYLKTEIEIAEYSGSAFGNKCWYATYEEILDTKIKG
ncbi:hypothetical protein WSM22_06540 [Cytophagales bacterium WSM2-2]|nr:hypothetical protein WSM22_06540 [Cytophagales bacterium WSM2-2]